MHAQQPASERSFSFMVGLWMVPAGKESKVSREERLHGRRCVFRIRRRRWPTTWRSRDGPLTVRRVQWCWWATPTAAWWSRKPATIRTSRRSSTAAFAPDKGESVATLIANPAPGAPVPPILPPQDGAPPPPAKFAASFAAGRRSGHGLVHGRLSGAVGSGSSRRRDQRAGVDDKAALYLVATDDHMIPPTAQRAMATRAGSTVVRSGQPCR